MAHEHQRRSIKDIQRDATVNQAAIMAEVHNTSVPQELRGFIDRYDAAGWGRDEFLWQWVWRLLNAPAPSFTLSCVPEHARRQAALVKIVYLLGVTMTDDAADERQDGVLVDRLCACLNGWDVAGEMRDDHALSVSLLRDLLDFAEDLLADVDKDSLSRAMLRFDLAQTWNAFSHAWFVNAHPQAITYAEALNYGGHNMMMTVFADIDLCFSEGVEPDETPTLREAFAAAQDMARVGNWVTTWRRELPVGDLTSGVVAHLLTYTGLTAEGLKTAVEANELDPVYALVEDSGAETALLDFWSERRDDLLALAPRITSFDVGAYVDGLESVMLHHFASIGAK